jgi:hypothetical protein
MDEVSTRIGPLLFDHADYDAELYLQLGESEPGEGEEMPEDTSFALLRVRNGSLA